MHLIFVIASPLAPCSDYLQSVAALLSWVHDIEFRKELGDCSLTNNVKVFLDMLEKKQYKTMAKALS